MRYFVAFFFQTHTEHLHPFYLFRKRHLYVCEQITTGIGSTAISRTVLPLASVSRVKCATNNIDIYKEVNAFGKTRAIENALHSERVVKAIRALTHALQSNGKRKEPSSATLGQPSQPGLEPLDTMLHAGPASIVQHASDPVDDYSFGDGYSAGSGCSGMSGGGASGAS